MICIKGLLSGPLSPPAVCCLLPIFICLHHALLLLLLLNGAGWWLLCDSEDKEPMGLKRMDWSKVWCVRVYMYVCRSVGMCAYVCKAQQQLGSIGGTCTAQPGCSHPEGLVALDCHWCHLTVTGVTGSN